MSRQDLLILAVLVTCLLFVFFFGTSNLWRWRWWVGVVTFTFSGNANLYCPQVALVFYCPANPLFTVLVHRCRPDC